MAKKLNIRKSGPAAAARRGGKVLGADAVIHIRNAPAMTEERKMAIAEWMREKANDLLAESHEWAAMWTARYNPAVESPAGDGASAPASPGR